MIGYAKPKTYFEKIRYKINSLRSSVIAEFKTGNDRVEYEKAFVPSSIEQRMAGAAVEALLKMEDEKKVA